MFRRKIEKKQLHADYFSAKKIFRYHKNFSTVIKKDTEKRKRFLLISNIGGSNIEL